MFVMNMSGGFANQLFRFACGYQIARKYNQEMILQIYDKKCYVDAFLLDELNLPNYKRIYTRTECEPEKIAELWGFKNLVKIDEQNFSMLNESTFNNDTLVYINAPFQKTIYFEEYIEEIRNIFQLKNVSEEIRKFQIKLLNQNSVAIHVRRRDFVDIRNAYGCLLVDNNFYKAAIVFLRKKLDNPMFYVFSDDIPFCMKHFGIKDDINFIKIPGGKDADIKEFFGISWCKNRILTRGSSFGRMADLLNPSKDKITIYQGNDKNKEHIIYLNEDNINKLAKEYNNPEYEMHNCLKEKDDFTYDDRFEKAKLSIYLERVQKEYKAKRLDYAEQALIKSWQYGYGNCEFHEAYFDVLQGIGKRKEALIEAIAFLRAGGDKHLIENKLTEDEINLINIFLNKKRQRFFIIPEEPYKNAELNQLCNLGILLQRMGNKTCYFFREAKVSDPGNSELNNEILRTNYMYTNCEGYQYISRMYDIDTIKKQYKIVDFIEEIVQGDICFVISDNYEMLKECKNKSMKKVFWKVNNTYRRNSCDSDKTQYQRYPKDWIVVDTVDSADQTIKINEVPWSYEAENPQTLSEQYSYDDYLFYVIEQILLGYI